MLLYYLCKWAVDLLTWVFDFFPAAGLSLPNPGKVIAMMVFMDRFVPVKEVFTIVVIYLTALPALWGIYAVLWIYERIPFKAT